MSAIKKALTRQAEDEDIKCTKGVIAICTQLVDECDAKIRQLDDDIAANIRLINYLEELNEEETKSLEQAVILNQLRMCEAQRRLEDEKKKNQKMADVVNRLTEKKEGMEREIRDREQDLEKRKRYKEILCKMAFLKFHEEADAFLDSLMLDIAQGGLTAVGADKLMILATSLSEQNLFQSQVTKRMEKSLTQKQTYLKELEQQDHTQSIDVELTRLSKKLITDDRGLSKLKQLVSFAQMVPTNQADMQWKALSGAVEEVYATCMGRKCIGNTIELLCAIEGRVIALLERIDTLPKDTLKRLKKMIRAERRTKQNEENLAKLRARESKTKERCYKRTMCEVYKWPGKKLMQRSKVLDRDVKDVCERPETPEVINWDKEQGKIHQEHLVDQVWAEWRLENEKRLLEQEKLRGQKKKPQFSSLRLQLNRSRRVEPEPVAAAAGAGAASRPGRAAPGLPSAQAGKSLPQLYRSYTEGDVSKDKSRAGVIDEPHVCLARQRAVKANNNLMDLSTLLRMRRLR